MAVNNEDILRTVFNLVSDTVRACRVQANNAAQITLLLHQIDTESDRIVGVDKDRIIRLLKQRFEMRFAALADYSLRNFGYNPVNVNNVKHEFRRLYNTWLNVRLSYSWSGAAFNILDSLHSRITVLESRLGNEQNDCIPKV